MLMNKSSLKLMIRLFLGSVLLIAGNTFYFLLSSFSKLPTLQFLPYVILIITYVLFSLLLNPIPKFKHRVLYYIFDIFLILLLFSPFIFPSSLISLYIIETHLYIFLSLLLGYCIKLTILISKKQVRY